MRLRSPSLAHRAFTLIELIVVITIIGLLALLIIPAASTIIMGSDMTRASQVLASQLSLARQTAITKNHAVEVRFLKYADPEIPRESMADESTWKFRAIQLLEVFENGNKALIGQTERLPGSVMMDNDRFSSLIATTEVEDGQSPLREFDATNDKDAPPLTRVAKKTKGNEQTSVADAKTYKYVAFRFLPDGSTNLKQNGKWYVTIYNEQDKKKLPDNGAPQINYFTAQVDPASGSVRTFRPTAGSRETGGTSAAQ